jgi:ribosomal peptide maturation radical SAM protein 1
MNPGRKTVSPQTPPPKSGPGWPGFQILESHPIHHRIASHSMAKASNGIPVALVSMPWGAIAKPSLALALLKPCLQRAGFVPHVHLLNMLFAQQIGLRLYEDIADGFFYPEWFFSTALFGANGLGEIENSWNDLSLNPAGADLKRQLARIAGGSEALCAKIATEYVPRFIEACLAHTNWSDYLVVGFTTTFAQSLSSLLLAKRIKETYPQVKIVFGGANVDAQMGVEFIHAFPWIDYVVHGEAEDTFPTLLNHVASGQTDAKVPGVSMRRGQDVLRGDRDARPQADLNASPLPDYSDYLHELERCDFSKKLHLELCYESSRGCWWGAKHHCTFCGLNGTTMAFRAKDPARVYSEILELSSKYHCLSFTAADNILDLEYFTQLLPRLAELHTDIRLFYEVKANINPDQVRLLRAAGITRIQPGIESFNSRILRLMRKGVTVIQNIQLLKCCYEIGIDATYNILYGFPGEVPADYTDLPHLFRLLFHLRPPSGMAPVLFERFSPYFFDKASFGLELRPLRAYSLIFPDSRVDLNEIAYFFEGKWQGQAAAPEEYMGEALETWRIWSKHWQEQNVFFHYSKGPNYLIIYDNRPRIPGASPRVRKIRLDEEVSCIYLFCDEHRSFSAINKMMTSKFGSDVSEDAVRSWLDALVFQGLMFREGDRYLALAVHKEAQSRPTGKSMF